MKAPEEVAEIFANLEERINGTYSSGFTEVCLVVTLVPLCTILMYSNIV